MRLSVVASTLGLLVLVGLVGCSGGREVDTSGPKQAYQNGMEEYEEENYDKAIRYFRSVFNYGRGNQWAPDAQFQLAMAQRQVGKHLVAANEFKRFTQLYRNHAKVPRAEFEQAKSYYLRSPQYHLDQKDTRKAIELFQLFIDRYPDHKRVSDAKDMVNELQAKLAHKKYDAAHHYERREMWGAATRTYRSLFDQYPETPWADDALLGALRSYIGYGDDSVVDKQAERYQKAIDQYEQLKQLFPQSPLVEKAETLKAEAKKKLREVPEQTDNAQSFAQDTDL